jgi:hypothetical protein
MSGDRQLARELSTAELRGIVAAGLHGKSRGEVAEFAKELAISLAELRELVAAHDPDRRADCCCGSRRLWMSHGCENCAIAHHIGVGMPPKLAMLRRNSELAICSRRSMGVWWLCDPRPYRPEQHRPLSVPATGGVGGPSRRMPRGGGLDWLR